MRTSLALASAFLAAFLAISGRPLSAETLTGSAAFGDWQTDAPGVRRVIRPEDLPPPDVAGSTGNAPELIDRGDRVPIAPGGFEVSLFADGLNGPRTLRVAPNGDVFVAESDANRITVLRPQPDGAPPTKSTFAGLNAGLAYPYGMAFWPPGPEPKYLYVGNTVRVLRFAYGSGDLVATAAPEMVVPKVPLGGHVTRALEFSTDGSKMYLAVGSGTNAAERLKKLSPDEIAEFERGTAVGNVWGTESGRATVVEFDSDGKNSRIFANGIRNCSGLVRNDATGDIWCAVNERDILGDDLVPDYLTRLKEGGFYGWPWYYIGEHEDPRHAGERPDLIGKITLPDVLLQAYSAPLGIVFYDADQFPAEYRGSGFATMHGSWNRSKRTGYKVVRIIMQNGVPTGEYEDFLTGFVASDSEVWGRPVGIAVDKDGGLLVSEDANGTIWRVTHLAGG